MRWGGFPLSCARRTTNQAFAKFLRIVEQPSDSSLQSIFSCPTCETPNGDGTTRIDGVAMDGIATGILGALPRFNRPIMEVIAAKDTAQN